MVIHYGEEFYRENAMLDKDYERAVYHVEFFVDWIWGISKKKVRVTNFLIWAGDAKTSKYSDQPHKDCIMGSTNMVENAQPSTSDSTDVLSQLTEGISGQNERIVETNNPTRQAFDINKWKDDDNKDRMSKLHSSFLNMLLNASSTDRDRAAKEITAACHSFSNQETADLENQELSVLFRELGFTDVGFAHGFFQAFLSGQCL